MKKSKKKVNNQYSRAWDETYTALPKWKKDLIDEAQKTKKDNSFYVEFIKEVIRKAESDQ